MIGRYTPMSLRMNHRKVSWTIHVWIVPGIPWPSKVLQGMWCVADTCTTVVQLTPVSLTRLTPVRFELRC